jgi:hypothetical protein
MPPLLCSLSNNGSVALDAVSVNKKENLVTVCSIQNRLLEFMC